MDRMTKICFSASKTLHQRVPLAPWEDDGADLAFVGGEGACATAGATGGGGGRGGAGGGAAGACGPAGATVGGGAGGGAGERASTAVVVNVAEGRVPVTGPGWCASAN